MKPSGLLNRLDKLRPTGRRLSDPEPFYYEAATSTSDPSDIKSQPLQANAGAVTKRSHRGRRLTQGLRDLQRKVDVLNRAESAPVNRLGLSLVHTPSEPLVDLIFVHGLTGTSHGTWSWQHDPDNFWPIWMVQDAELSQARLFTFGYSPDFKQNNPVTIPDFSRQLLVSMKSYSGTGAINGAPVGKYPVVFIAHSFGGLVVKKAYITAKSHEQYQDIASQIRAMLFFGTPHRDSAVAESLSKILRPSWDKASVAELLKTASIHDINNEFRTRCAGLKLVSFYETRETEIRGTLKSMIVDKDSAVLWLPSELSGPMDTDHYNLSKFDSVEDPGYQRVRNCLSVVVKGIRTQAGTAPETVRGPTEIMPGGHSMQSTTSRFFPATFGPERTTQTRNWNRNRHFAGRRQILQVLHETLDRHGDEPEKTPPHAALLYGMGGIGKTQIANQYVHQLRAPYLVYFIHCETPVSILESYRRCLREPSGLDPELVVERFAQQVRELDKLWLIIFDNVGDADAFAKFGPDALQLGEGRGSFLLTTRYPPSRLSIAKHKVQRFKAVEVGLMDTDEAKELLLHALDPDEVDSSELSAMIDRAGGFPLALSMLPTLLRGKTTPTTSPGAEGLWKYQIPPPSSSLANEYLFGLACLDVTGIPIDILVEYERCASLAMGAKEALYLLVGSHVIRYAGGGQIMMDQLVRDTGLTQLRSQDRLELIARLAMDAVANLYQRRKILPDPYATQVEALMELESASPYRSLETNLAKGRLFLAKGTFFLSQGLPAAAEGPLRRSLDVYSGLAGYEDRDMLAMVVPALATAYLAQGRDAEAEQLEARYQTRVADAEQYNAHSDNETEDQEADDVEIESVISNLPSLTAGSTISSALSLALIEDIKADVLSILTKDEGFHGLFQETPKRITHDKFQRNFLRLFRSFLSDIRKQSDDGEQELRQVIRILRYQSRNIASHICQQIFDLKAQSDALLSLARQVPDKGGQLTSFFGDESAPELASALKEQPFDEGDSSGGESEEPEAVRSHPVPLGDLEIIILESNSFLTFRERYRTFLFPRSDPQPLEADIPTENKHPTVEMDRSDPSIEPTSEPIIRPSLLQEGFAFVKAGVQRLIRPPIKEGYIRLEWRCDCGDSLYADFAESDADSIRQLEASLKGHAPHAGGGTAPSQPNHPPGGASAPTPAPGPPPSQPPYNTQSNNTGQTPGQNQPPVAAGGVTHTSGPASQAKKRFIELCINTGEFQRQLAEIDISTVASDAQLFERIRERYREVRSFRVKYFLLKPVDVHFVQFSVEDRHRVGILDKPMAIPTVAEMAAEGYAYHPCPLRPPPIPANIFLHHLSKPGQHPKLLWGNRIPQKLHKSILQIQTPDDLVTGWGVHIIEGLNMTTVLLCSLAGLLVSMIVAVVWAVVKGDVQGAFGIGAWVTSVEAILVMLVVTKWLET